ncbi:MAG: glycosyltransferase family 2 protein [Bacteroidetes bacterium]|nr:glycosyltransferase family 2 protein [Bacteroidota bacterium]
MKTTSLPRVSVLVPAYNEEKYIHRTLSALVTQDYPDYEIIVTNNASSDGTALVVQTFINQQPVTGVQITLIHESRKGTNYARESARKQAGGQIIAQMDSRLRTRFQLASQGRNSTDTKPATGSRYRTLRLF